MKNYIRISVINLGIFSMLFACNSGSSEQQSNSEVLRDKMTDSAFIELGLNYTQSAQKVLGKNMKQAIKSKGAEYAIEFCNNKAL